MTGTEGAAWAIVVLFVALRAAYGPAPRDFLRRFGWLVVSSWLAEETVLCAYGFYEYDARWSLFIDRVPLCIACIWPIVLHSAWELARALVGGGHRLVPLVGALVVLADASLIEPIAVRAGLWRWTEPGLFDVPPIGILGWALYAGLAIVVLERSDGRRGLLLLLGPPQVGTHLLLLGAWWGLFAWVNVPWSGAAAAVVAWLIAAAAAVLSLRSAASRRVHPRELLLRVPGALFFFALLGQGESRPPALVAYALAFAPPWLTLLDAPSRWRLRG